MKQELIQKRDRLLREVNASGKWDQAKYDEVQTLAKRLEEMEKLPDPPSPPKRPPRKGR